MPELTLLYVYELKFKRERFDSKPDGIEDFVRCIKKISGKDSVWWKEWRV